MALCDLQCVRFMDTFSDDGKDSELGLMGRDPQTVCVFRDDGNPQTYVAGMQWDYTEVHEDSPVHRLRLCRGVLCFWSRCDTVCKQ